jgi:hypothetical protein
MSATDQGTRQPLRKASRKAKQSPRDMNALSAALRAALGRGVQPAEILPAAGDADLLYLTPIVVNDDTDFLEGG